jgi:hypothetical protein
VVNACCSFVFGFDDEDVVFDQDGVAWAYDADSDVWFYFDEDLDDWAEVDEDGTAWFYDEELDMVFYFDEDLDVWVEAEEEDEDSSAW